MAAQFKTLGDIIQDIRFRGNLAGYESRFPDDDLKNLWNDSQQALREMISTHKDSPYLQRTAPAALPTVAAVTGDVYAVVDWPVNALSIHSVRVKDSDNRWRPLKEILPGALHDYQSRNNNSLFLRDGLPIAYVTGNVPQGSGATENAGTIEIVPIPTTGSYSVWYIENWTPITDDTDTVNCIAGFHEWTIWDVIVKSSGKSGKGGHTYNNAVNEREAARVRIEDRARRLSASGTIEPRDGRRDGYRLDIWGDNF